MPRAKAILQSEYPYHISARCINREWFNIPMPRVWEIFCQELQHTSEEKKLLVHSFVLMSNHYHMIASTPEANISQCMHQLMKNVSHRLTREGNRINETFAGRHFKCILHERSYFLNAYKYNYRNPIAAGICKYAEDYPYSTLHGLAGRSIKPGFLIDDLVFNADPIGVLKWLNTTPDPRSLEGVRYGLKRQYFQVKKCSISRRPLLGKNDVL